MKFKTKLLALFCFIVSTVNLFSQGETWRWNFGANAALNFPGGGNPVSTPGSAMNTFEGCASIGLPNGNLAFYTSGATIWGANNVPMPNGMGLFGNSSTTQAAIIVPRPGMANRYYVFCSSSNFSPGTLSYSEVDMTLNAPWGNVIAGVKNIVIQNNISEKLTAVRHCNGIDVWVIVHDYTNSDYKAFLVTATGVSLTPVVSSAGAPTSGNVVGAMKVSPNGKKIAYCASNSPFALHVADFNNSTGVINNVINLAGNAGLVPMYGLEFSPDSKILYGSKWASSNQVYQWDLCQASAAGVVGSALMVGSGGNTHGSMQLGPNGKIYICRAASNQLAVINNPNVLGVGCGYNQNGVTLTSGTSQYGLPTFIQSYLTVPAGPITATMVCLTGQFAPPTGGGTVSGCPSSTASPTFTWNFGDPLSGASNTSTVTYPTHVFTNPGVYTVTLLSGSPCNVGTSSIVVTAISCSPNVVVPSSSICPGACATLSATASGGTGPYTYTWIPNIGSGAGTHTVCPTTTTTYSIIIADAMGVTATNTAVVFTKPAPIITINSPTACVNNSLVLTATGGTSYAWSGPSSFTSSVQSPTVLNMSVATSGNYSVIVTNNVSCTNIAVTTASAIALPVLSIAGSNNLCAQGLNGSINTATITASGASTYSWVAPSSVTTSNPNFSTLTMTSNVTVPTNITVTVSATAASSCSNTLTYPLTILANPVITAVSASMCAQTNTVISASGAIGYVWSGASLSSNSGASVTANPSVTTVYSVFGTSLNCNSASVNPTVTVLPLPILNILPATATVCSGTSINLTASGATNYTWSPSSSLSSAFGANVSASPVVNTLYTLIGEAATCTASTTKEVTVIPMPVLNPTASNGNICVGEQVLLNASGATTYTWEPAHSVNYQFGNSTTSLPQVTTIYTLTGNNGECSGKATVIVSVTPRPNFNLSISKTGICFGDNTTIVGNGAQFYSWAPNTNISINAAGNVGVAQPTAGTTYTVIGYNLSGTLSCGVTKMVFVEVVPTIDASISSSVEICLGESTQLTSSGSNTYKWLPVDGLNDPNIASPIASPKKTTEYIVSVSNMSNCPVTKTVTVKVNPLPSVTAGDDQVINADEPILITASGTGTLTWIAGEGIVCAPCPTTQVITSNSGLYIIEAISNKGCIARDQLNIDVTKNHNLYIPNSFTPNEDGKNDLFMIYGTGIQKIELTVFDRWGEKLFYTKDINVGWDGSYKGVICKSDVYVYLLNYIALDGKKYTKKGHVSILK
ncbi:MAG: gliding motility-associated C-terminal domain-containing protein [Bacteroidia bacterium]